MKSFSLRLAFSACLFFFLFATPVHAVEHPSYNIRANLDWENKSITAEQTVTFTNGSSKETDNIYFHIYPNRYYTPEERNLLMRYAGYFKANPYPEGFPEPDMTIQSITSASGALPYAIEGDDKTILRVKLPQSLKQNQAVTLTIRFRLKIPHAYGRFGWHGNIIRLSRWYPVLSSYKGGVWRNYEFYPFHRPFVTDASTYRVELTVPKNQVVIHSGLLDREQATSTLTKTLILKADKPVREFTMAMSPAYKVAKGTFNEVVIKSFYLPGDEEAAESAVNIARDLMAYYTKRFNTDYPYEEFSIAPVHLGYGGEQMANLIFIDTRVYKLPKILTRHFDFLIAHETGHQWLYNLVGMDEYSQLWMEEGLNSFFIMEYLENKYGENAQILQWPEKFKFMESFLPELTFRRARDFRHKLIARTGFDYPVIGELGSFREPSSIFSVAYGKGSRVVAMLEDHIGKDAFARVIRRVFKEFAYDIIDVKDFIRLCTEESNRDLSAFFNDWLYSKKQLDYGIAGVRGSVITVVNRGEIDMPVDIRVTFKDGRTSTYIFTGQGRRVETFKVDDSGVIKQAVIDPDKKVIDMDRTNNSWPRIVHVHMVPLYLGLYDIPVLLPDDGYNLVAGPDVSKGLGVKASIQKPYDQIFYLGTGYELGEDLHHSRAGYQLNNVFHTQTALGFEIANRTDHDNGEEDLVSGKMYLRRELWPVQYGLGDINDHITLYLLRNHGLNDRTELLHAQEDERNLDFSRREESIVGTTLHLNRSGPYPDPREGYKFDTTLESAGHFLKATQFFYRGDFDLGVYKPVTKRSTLALRMKYAWGFPNDKDLFHLGGIDGLRGYDQKDIRGANAFLGSVEYRFPIKDDINAYFLDNIFGLNSVGGAAFFDAGRAWFNDYDESSLKKNAGFGLRWTVSLGAFLEKVVLRSDVAFPINEDGDDDARFWFGVNSAF